MKSETQIGIEGVDFSFGGTKVLADISFTILKGDFIGIIGPNGSGKTTLVKLMLGLLPLQSGKITLFGADVRDFREWHRIAYVPQKATNIDPAFPATVREVASMGLLSRKAFPKMLAGGDREKIEGALRHVGMDGYGGRRIGELSGGQQQRVYIARALASEPEVLFLDEPTAGVDQATQGRFYDLLGQLNREGITIVLVSHDIGRITRYVNKVASLNQRLEFYGSHPEFCAWDAKHQHKTEQEHNLCLHRG